MAEQTQAPVLPDGAISEWRPSRASVVAWTILSLPITALAFLVYLTMAVHGSDQIARCRCLLAAFRGLPTSSLSLRPWSSWRRP